MERQTIKCVFCKGGGVNPHFKGTCPVCKGKGENQVMGKYTVCGDCRGSGQKRGTALTCYACAGLGVVPDMREELRQARQEIKKVRGEMEEERTELTGRQPKVDRKAGRCKQWLRELVDENIEENLQIQEKTKSVRFCQSCAKSTEGNDIINICLECFGKINKLDSR